MMDDQKLAPGEPVDPALESQTGQAETGQPAVAGPAEQTPAPAAAPAPAPVSPAVEKFRSCRWRATPEDGEYCTHRDVLPFAGKEGFVAESWCPDCAFYKLRRTPKKRERVDYSY
jgi:hypothetical protein